MIPIKRLFTIACALLLLGLTILLVSTTHPLITNVRGSNRTISLIGYYPSGWNSSQMSGANPTITVTQGDTVMMQLSSGDNAPHRFLVDFDRDANPTDTADCPTTDPCSGTFSTSTITSYTFTVSSTITPGNYKYICVIHYPYMVGTFAVQAAPTPDFTIMSNPSFLTFLQGSSGMSTITVTSTNGFSGTVNLVASISPVSTGGPTASFTPSASVTISAGTSGTSTLTVSTTASTLSGAYTVKVNGTSGSTVHTTTVTVQVNAPTGQDFSITANPASLNVTQGSSSSSTITLTSVNGFSGILSLTKTVSPSGPSATLSLVSVSLPASGSVTSTLTVSATAGASVATGSYSVNVTATNGSLSNSKIVAVIVSSTTSPPPAGTPGLPVAVVVGAAIAIIAAIGVVVYLVRRKPVAT